MLKPNQKIVVKWCSSNKEWYQAKGYVYTKLGEELEILADDLPLGSHYKVGVICSYCGEEYLTPFVQHLKSERNKGDCCTKCRKHKFSKVCEDKYGVSNPFQREETKEKIRQTCIEKYGTERACQSSEVKAKIASTNMDKYGATTFFQSEVGKKQIADTLLEKYGVDNIFKDHNMQERIRITNAQKYGDGNIAHIPSIAEKIRSTNMERYGVPYTTQSKDIQRKMRESFYRKGRCNSSIEEEKLIESLIRIYGKDCCFPCFPLDTINMDCLLCVDGCRIDVEYDGWYWHKDKKEQDRRRNYFVMKQGYKILRFLSKGTIPSDEEIKKCVDYLVKDNHHIKIVEVDI